MDVNTADKWITIVIATVIIASVGFIAYATPTPRTLEDAMSSTVKVATSSGHGSGFVISEEGHILTNQHVCGTEQEFKVTRPDGSQANAKAIWVTNRDIDLCLIKAEDHAVAKLYGTPGIELVWTPLPFAEVEPSFGDEVLIIGNPFELEWVVTRGIVSNPSQKTAGYTNGEARLQIDAVAGPGNSGGPVLNAKFELIGVLHAGRTVRGVPSGWNFAVTLDTVRDTLAQ